MKVKSMTEINRKKGKKIAPLSGAIQANNSKVDNLLNKNKKQKPFSVQTLN